MSERGIRILSAAAGLWLGLSLGGQAAAQNNQFGAQDRADAAERMIVLGVQQAIGSLPPTSGQALSFAYDPELGEIKQTSTKLGPTVVRSAETIGQGQFSLRVAASYFEVSDTFAAVPYFLSDPAGAGVAKIGLRVEAQVGLFNVAASYGVTPRLELTTNLPIVVTDAQAWQIFSTRKTYFFDPPRSVPLSGRPVGSDGSLAGPLAALDEGLSPNGTLALRQETFRDLGYRFHDGTSVGVGRISIGAKAVLYSEGRWQLAATPEFFFPSPQEDELAGAGSAAILPRLVGVVTVHDPLKLHLDAGYDYDFQSDELRRFVWSFGASLGFEHASFDAAVGGSQFNQGIAWTPASASYTNLSGSPGTISVLGDNRLGTTFIDFLFGMKFRLGQRLFLSQAVVVPVNNEGFRPDVLGTIAVEAYL